MGDRWATINTGRKLGAVPLWGRRRWVPSNTMWPGLRPTTLRSDILIHPAVTPQQACAENWTQLPLPLWSREGELGPHLTQYGQGRGLPPYKWHLDQSSRLVTTDMGRQLGAEPLWGRRAGSSFNTVWRRPTSMPSFILIHTAVWYNRHGPRIIRTQAKPAPVNFECGDCCAPFRGEQDPNLTQCGQGRCLPACQVSS